MCSRAWASSSWAWRARWAGQRLAAVSLAEGAQALLLAAQLLAAAITPAVPRGSEADVTSPTIIQTPGALDTASQAFQQSFALFRQLAEKRQALDLERQRITSQVGLEDAQKQQIKANTLRINAEIQRTDAQLAGQRLAMQLHQEDDPTFEAHLQQLKVDPDTNYWAHEARMGIQQQQASTQRDQQQAQVGALQLQQLQRQALVRDAVTNVLKKYEGDILTNPASQAKAVADIWTVDPQAALQQADAFNAMGRQSHVQALDDGSILTSDDRGKWHITAHAWGGKVAAGGQTAALNVQERLVAARQTLSALQNLQALARVDPDGVVEPPVATTFEDARGLIGKALAGGAGQTTAQASRTAHQQMASMYGNQFIDNYFKFIRGGNTPRSQQFITNFRRAYLPIGPLKPGVGQAAYKNRQDLIDQTLNFVKQFTPDKPFDTTTLPGFSESLNADAQVQQAGGATGSPNFAAQPWNPNK